MKRSLLLFSFLMLLFSGCGDDGEPKAKCIETTSTCPAAGSYKTCSDAKSTWYTWKDKKYPCAAKSDCTAAAQQLALDILDFCN